MEMKKLRSFENQKIMNEEVLINSGCFVVLDYTEFPCLSRMLKIDITQL